MAFLLDKLGFRVRRANRIAKTPRPGQSVLPKGWKMDWSQDPDKFDKAIKDDYQDYIHKLSPKEGQYMGSVRFFEDGTGKYAVQIEIYFHGWFANYTRAHFLIYGRDQTRRK